MEQQTFLQQVLEVGDMARLNEIPDQLCSEGALIRQQMETLAFENYKSFLATSDCIGSIHQKVGVFQ
jgi:hypothetical protein